MTNITFMETILVHLISNTALKTRKDLQVAEYRILKSHRNFNFCLIASQPASLTTVTRPEAKRSSAQPPFYATITNSPVGCAFWGSN